ncbi:hypothetical protein Poly30_52260 [Planctomycetes bacterium Poly30]|uniref:Uncharacterized protein n=1 Tax=Saltatorellus ferox TaxID=2528018 RepID=A0A518F002_9BACT|nr:hypothetical protein Poly30_52260 [Planctomycetes bacterium Poly30]
MLDRVQELQVEACDSSKLLGIDRIALRVVLVDQPQLAGVGDDHIVAELLEQFSDLAGLTASLDGDAQ